MNACRNQEYKSLSVFILIAITAAVTGRKGKIYVKCRYTDEALFPQKIPLLPFQYKSSYYIQWTRIKLEFISNI